jgi:hypothetical protein
VISEKNQYRKSISSYRTRKISPSSNNAPGPSKMILNQLKNRKMFNDQVNEYCITNRDHIESENYGFGRNSNRQRESIDHFQTQQNPTTQPSKMR